MTLTRRIWRIMLIRVFPLKLYGQRCRAGIGVPAKPVPLLYPEVPVIRVISHALFAHGSRHPSGGNGGNWCGGALCRLCGILSPLDGISKRHLLIMFHRYPTLGR